MNEFDGYMNIAVQYDPEFTVSYRSANFVFEEGLRNGRWVALSYNASGYLMGTNPVPKPPYMNIDELPCPESFWITLDGQSLCSHFTLENHEIQKGGKDLTMRITLRHQIRPVRLHVCTRLDGTPVIERHIEVENLKDEGAALSEYAPLAGGLQVLANIFGRNTFEKKAHEAVYRLGYFKDNGWGAEGSFVWEDLPDIQSTISGRYRREQHRHPMFVLNNKVTGEYFIGQLAWSGGWAFSFDYQNEIDKTPSMSVKFALDEPAPLCILKAKETWTGPAIHIGAVFGGLDNAVNSMHRHVRKFILPKKQNRRELVQGYIGPEFVMSEENTYRAMEYSASMGAELFFIDAGWYTPPGQESQWYPKVGDWKFDKERYPHGIAPIRDRCHELGMLFGVWVEAERLGTLSENLKKHREWIQTGYTGETWGLIDVSIPECGRWFEETIAGLITENGLDFFRLDRNIAAIQTINVRENSGWAENTRIRNIQATYQIFERLRSRFPDVVFENCASGGGRCDIGMSRYFTQTWVTDWQIQPNAFRVTNGMTMALPPEHINRVMGSQNAYLTADIRTQIRGLMFSQMLISPVFPLGLTPNESQLEIIRRHVAIYKNFVRPFIADSNIYHHTPELARDKNAGFGILELDAYDGKKGMLGVFQFSTDPKNEETTVKLRGIDASLQYRVTFENDRAACILSGYELVHKGIPIHLEGALTSELVLYEAVQ
jgi:alpha-galactosidase